MSIKIIVGLRNPGVDYALTRHNAGAWFVESLAASQALLFKRDKKLRGDWVIFDAPPYHSILFLPAAFMNVSGACVRSVCHFYHILPQELLVVHDDLDLPVGGVRLKTGGGHGGHNGVRDVIAHLQSNDFHRLRIGIGHPGHKDLVLDYVLAKPQHEDKAQIMTAISRAIREVPKLLSGQLSSVMSLLNER